MESRYAHCYRRCNQYILTVTRRAPTLPRIDLLGLPPPNCHRCNTTLDTASDRQNHDINCPGSRPTSRSGQPSPTWNVPLSPWDATPRTYSAPAMHNLVDRTQQHVVLPSHDAEYQYGYSSQPSNAFPPGHSRPQDTFRVMPQSRRSSSSACSQSSASASSVHEKTRTGRVAKTVAPKAQRDSRRDSRNILNGSNSPTPRGSVIPPDGNTEKKKDKEAFSRAEHGSMLQDMEDILEFILGIPLTKTQSAGNGNKAGLKAVKIEVYALGVGCLGDALQELRENAIMNGTLDEWEAKWQRKAEILRESHAPLAGTWLEGEKCCHEKNSKVCITHNHPDHTQCRKTRRRQAFERNQHRYYLRNNIKK